MHLNIAQYMKDKIILTSVELDELSESISREIEKALAELLPKLLSANSQDECELVLIKPSEAGDIAGHSSAFIRKLVKRGVLSAYYPGSDLRISKKELIEWLDTRKLNKRL